MSAPAAISIREFAKLDGCDESLVRRALRRGKLKADADGKLDPALAGSDWRRQNRRADKSADTRKKSARSVRTGPKRNVRTSGQPRTVEDLEAALNRIEGEEAADFLANLVVGKFADIAMAERIKENALAAKHLVAVRKEAGQLLEADLVEKVVFEEAQRARDAWLNFPSRVAPLLAADLGADAATIADALTAHVHAQLRAIGDPTFDFEGPQA